MKTLVYEESQVSACVWVWLTGWRCCLCCVLVPQGEMGKGELACPSLHGHDQAAAGPHSPSRPSQHHDPTPNTTTTSSPHASLSVLPPTPYTPSKSPAALRFKSSVIAISMLQRRSGSCPAPPSAPPTLLLTDFSQFASFSYRVAFCACVVCMC
jgi:hypothetical protein